MALINMRLIYEINTIEKKYKEYISDIKKINQALFNYYGIVGSFEEIYDLWEEVSNRYCAQWLIVPDNEKEIIDAIKSNIL